MNELFDTSSGWSTSGCRASPTTWTSAGGHATQLAWTPPAGGDVEAGLDTRRLVNEPDVEKPTAVAFGRYLEAQPVLVDVQLAREAIPALAMPGGCSTPARRSRGTTCADR